MESGSLTEALQETLAVFDGAGEPRTTPEIAKCLDLGRRSTYERLERLVEKKWLKTKKVGANARVWWRTPTHIEGMASEQPDIDGFLEKSHQQQGFAQQILDIVPVGVLIVKPDGTFTAANQRAVELLELEINRDGSYTVGIKDVYDEDGEFLALAERPYVQIFQTGKSVKNWHSQIQLSNGDWRWLSANIEPIIGKEDNIEQALVTIEDISKLKEQVAQLECRRNEFEDELNEIFGRITDAFYALDDEWRFTHLNERAEELIDQKDEGLINTNIWERFDWAAQSKLRDEYERALETQEPTSFEFYYPKPFDSWYKVNTYPSETGLSVYFQDITDRKERENELELYKTILSVINDGIYVLDEDYCFIEVNDAYVEMTGYNRDELLGEHCSLVIDDKVSAESAELTKQLASGEINSASLEADLHRADGSRLRAESNFAVLPSRTTATAQKVGVARDISERVERERTLRENEQRYRSLVENFPDGAVALFDENLQYTAAGGELLHQLDISSDEPVGESIYERYPDNLVTRVEPYFKAALEGEAGSLEVEYYDRDLFVSIAPVRDDDEVFSGILLVQDITERKERERELERKREQLAALNDLNSIVNNITGSIIDQSTREEIEQAVCDALAATDAYKFAWLAEVDSTTNTIEPRITAGTCGYAEQVTISTDPDDPTSKGPSATAIRKQEIQIVQDVFSDPSFESWRDAAAEYGFSSVASIPIVHKKTVYGVLGVYADRPNAFDSAEREVISQLGEVIGHAIAAIERKQALMSDELVELEFRIQDVFAALDIPNEMEGTITLDHTVQIATNEFLMYGTATADALDPLNGLVETLPHWKEIIVRSEDDPASFELRLTDPPVLSAVASLGGHIEQAVIEDTNFQLTVHLVPSVDVRRVIGAVESSYPNAEMLRRRQITRSRDNSQFDQTRLFTDLTDRQHATLKAAYHAGFFEWPRKTTGEEIAESLDVAPATFHQHLRKAEQKVFNSLISTKIIN